MVELILPENLSVVNIQYETKEESIHPELEVRISTALKEHNPDLIITPRYSFSDEERVRRSALMEQNKATALVSGYETGRVLNRLGINEERIFEKFPSEILIKPYVNKNNLAFLINLGENNDGIKNEFVHSLKIGGYYLKCNRTRLNYAGRNLDGVRIEYINVQQHKNKDLYDWYLLPISEELLKK